MSKIRTTYVGRLRVDPSVPNGLVFWVVADNSVKGPRQMQFKLPKCFVSVGVHSEILGAIDLRCRLSTRAAVLPGWHTDIHCPNERIFRESTDRIWYES